MAMKYTDSGMRGQCITAQLLTGETRIQSGHPTSKRMMNIELYVAIMAGTVLSFFLMVSEIVLIRKRLLNIRSRLAHFYRSRRFLRFYLEIFSIAAFFLVQPFIVGFLVVMALDNLNPHFSASVLHGLRQGLMAITG
jgi:uncharacterized membrane protein